MTKSPFCLRPVPALLLVLMCSGAVRHSSVAAPVTVINQGFEDLTGETIQSEFTFGPLLGWALYDPSGTNITSGGDGPQYFIGSLTPQILDPIGNPGVYENFPAGAAEGSRVGIAFDFAANGGAGEYGMVQVLSATLQANTQYTLRVEIGNIDSGDTISAGPFTLTGFPGYRVDLLAISPGTTSGQISAGAGAILDQDDNSLAGSVADGEFGTSTVTFTTGESHANLGQNLAIRLVNLNVTDATAPTSDLEVDFDNVRLDAVAVPEPDTGLLLALAACGLILARRERQTLKPALIEIHPRR